MIIAGIDEAGYGPLLGPLAVGCCAFEVEGDFEAVKAPCLWRLLRKVASKHRSKSGKTIHVNDSKLVYSPSAGLRELERAVLVLAACAWSDWTGTFDGLLERIASDLPQAMGRYPWYGRTDPAVGEALPEFPLCCDGLSLRLFAKAARQSMQVASIGCTHLCVNVVLEEDFNRQVEQTRNKASVLFSVASRHIDFLLRTFASRGLILYCDRHGGRERYGALLRLMFDDWSLQVIDEQPERSEYRLSRRNESARIVFCEKAEQECMAVAVASMLSKYLRELLMHRFNAFWSYHVPNLEPTAGYYNDGLRFLRDIEHKRAELKITDRQLIRSR